MSDENVELDYAYLAQTALRGVIRDVLTITSTMGGPPGDHHFYIEFVTGARGVEISDTLKNQYPDRMTIVLQHQFDDLEVGEDQFSVVLYFSGIAERLVVPYEAVTKFADPSVNFALQFDAAPSATEDAPSADIEPIADYKSESDVEDDDPQPDPPAGSADVVSLDRFRKK